MCVVDFPSQGTAKASCWLPIESPPPFMKSASPLSCSVAGETTKSAVPLKSLSAAEMKLILDASGLPQKVVC